MSGALQLKSWCEDEGNINKLEQTLPSGVIKATRFVKSLQTSFLESPALHDCSFGSLIECAMQAASVGLPFGKSLGLVYMVPFFDRKENVKKAQLIIGYKGYAVLAAKSGITPNAQIRREKDLFEMQLGTDPYVKHIIIDYDNRGPIVGAYAILTYNDDRKHVEYMNLNQLEDIRKRSKNSDRGPWKTDIEQMYRKTVLRRAFNYAPLFIDDSLMLAREVDGDVIETEIEPQHKVSAADINPSEVTVEAHAERPKEV